jgi:long-chain acyl-CoA synthetase
VRESHTPALVEVSPSANITDFVVRNATDRPALVVYRRKVGEQWQDVNAADFLAEVQSLAKGLVAAGVQPGDRVALMSRTRYEWTLTDCAIWFAGAVTVPIYETSSADQVQWILGDSGAVGVVVESHEHRGTVKQVQGDLPGLQHVWTIDDGDLDTLAARGTEVDDVRVEERRSAAGLDDLATIIYTSGTTGRPKGCELTHGNFVVLTENTVRRIEQVVSAEGASTLLFLPLAHVFARYIQVLCMASGATLGHSGDIKQLLGDLASFRPSFLLAVPRVFEKIYNSAEQKAEAGGRGKIFRRAAETAIEHSKALDTGSSGLGLRLRYALFDKLVYPKLRDAMGGRAEYAVSGGAPLGERLGHFFRGIGLTVLEGYGLTETTAPHSVNLPEKTKIGTVGPSLPGHSVRIGEDGEILLKGPHVFRGYWNNPAATAEAIRDGWFHTGDLGELDSDGYLRITGRKKEILVTAGGKNVAPAVLEDRLRAHPLVSQCIVVGDAKPFIAALITIDEEMLPAWLSNNDLPSMTPAEAAKDATVLAALQAAVDDANKAVSKAESIRKFEVLDIDFTVESGHLTPSLKLKRNVVMDDYADAVERLYA